MRGQAQGRELDRAIVALAERQHGKVARRQLLALGLGAKAIDYRVQTEELRVDYRGVYSLGHHPTSPESRWMAAVLYGGAGAVLSHWSAATLWRMRQGVGPRSHVTMPRQRHNNARITFHEAQLSEDEKTAQRGVPTTTPARTLLDLALLLPSPILTRMIDAAPGRGAPLAELLARYPRRGGTRKLRKLLATPMPMTRSDLEAMVLSAIEQAGLPKPDVNGIVEGYEADFVWRDYGVIAELDTYMTHGSRDAFERDRDRDRKLTIAGWTVVRLTDESGLDDLSRLLAATAARSRAAA